MNRKQIEGNFGEKQATKYLESLGYEIICNNFKCMQGEIDIIARDKNEIVFVEVKTRASLRYGNPKEAVDERKLDHIFKAGKYYLYKNHEENKFVRIDVIEVYLRYGDIMINHIKQAV